MAKNKPKKDKDNIDHKPFLGHVSSADLKEISDWDIGEKYTLEVEVQMESIRMRDEYMPEEDKGEKFASFKILDIKSIGSKGKMERLKDITE